MSKKREKKPGFFWSFPRLALLGTWVFSLCFAALFVFVLHKARLAYPSSWESAATGSSLLECTGQASPGPDRGAVAAIVIDDLGLDLEAAEELLRLDFPVTLAVLPYRKHSLEVADMAFKRGREVLLHLPMEPRDFPLIDPGPGCLLVSMDREAIQQELQDQIASLPNCVGVNPHMGTLFTEMPGPMRYVAAVLKERDLFFLDNRASSGSRAASAARAFGVPFVQRTHFLDEKRDEAAVIRQLCRLADFAAGNGWAVGIGHPYPETLAALPQAVAAFEEKNVKLVPVSGLLPLRTRSHTRSARLLPDRDRKSLGRIGRGMLERPENLL